MSRARKGTRGGASSSGSAPQPEEAMLTATVVTERNLDLSPSIQTAALMHVQHLLRDRHLLPLARLYGKYNESVVREFYAAFPKGEFEANENVPIKVRGKNFELSPSIISEVLHIPEHDTSDWKHSLLGHFEMQSAAETIFYADPAAFASQAKKTVLIQGKLTPYFAILWSFVRHNIYPSGQRSEIPTMGGRILQALHEGYFSLPICDIIFERLKACARKKNIIYYPCLVSMLCERSGVRARPTDISVEPMGPISDTSVSKSISQRRHAHAPAPVQPHMPPPPPHRPASSQPFPPAPSVDTSAWEPSLQAIWDLQMLQYQQMRQQHQQMQHMSTSIDAIWTHLQMPGQPGTAAHNDVVDGDDDGDDDDDDVQ
ncbi:hypothetical protein ACE6H2_008887 [Prunus campanulata]